MRYREAFKIVLELAEQNALSEREVSADIDLKEEMDRQSRAIKMVESYRLNHWPDRSNGPGKKGGEK